jgi:hypothetical protein
MNFIVDKMNEFKKRVFYTGTYIPNLTPKFANFDIIRVKKSREKKFNLVRYHDKMVACEKLCDRNGLNVIYLQNTQMERTLGDYKNYFLKQGWKEKDFVYLNSSTKNKEYFKNIIDNEVIDVKHKVVFSTSIIAEGLNFNNDKFTNSFIDYLLTFCNLKKCLSDRRETKSRQKSAFMSSVFLSRKYLKKVLTIKL